MNTMVITGCNRGVGEGVAKLFLDKGYKVFGLNRTPSKIKNPNFINIRCDISKTEEVKSAINEIKNIDLMIINSAIRRFDNLEDMSEEDFSESLSINLEGAFRTLKYSIPKIKSSKGDIIFIGSHSEKYPFEKGVAYVSSKLGLKGLSDCLMDELRYDDVRVSYLSLGAIKNRDHGYDESWKLTPNDVAQTTYSIHSLPKNILIPYLDVRPIKPKKHDISGLERLQYV